jgi:tryptophan halogenase
MVSGGFVERIVIVGGGTAGWMVAAALSRAIRSPAVSITLIESDEIGTVGVGEATLPAIRNFNALVGIDERELLRACDGGFKLGIEFRDWGELGGRYMHPFSHYGGSFNNKLFTHLWVKYAHLMRSRGAPGSPPAIDGFNMGSLAAVEGRFSVAAAVSAQNPGGLDYAYHFDANLYAKFLRRLAEGRRVVRIEGEVVSTAQHAETGFIESVALKSGQVVAGDFFIDCSGFRGLLIEQALKAGYDDWRHWLPCDRAIAVACENTEPPLPYTRSTAGEAGWFWRIPLQSRVGNGHVYSSAFIDDETAEEALLAQLDGRPISPPRKLRFVTGRRRKAWDRNCLAVGLAAGFMEPLESTSIHLIQTAILRLLSLFPDKGFDQDEIDEFNRQTAEEYENARDFLVAHYHLNTRTDAPFWRQCAEMSVPDGVRRHVALFAAKGRLPIRQEHTFATHSWTAVLLGQGVMPRGYDPMLADAPAEDIEMQMQAIRKDLVAKVSSLPPHGAFLKQYCPSASGGLH